MIRFPLLMRWVAKTPDPWTLESRTSNGKVLIKQETFGVSAG